MRFYENPPHDKERKSSEKTLATQGFFIVKIFPMIGSWPMTRALSYMEDAHNEKKLIDVKD